MNKREKVILIITAIVAVVAGYLMFFDSGTKVAGIDTESLMSIDELQKFVNEMSDTVSKDTLSDKDAYVIEMATSPWANDPFSDVQLPDESDKKQATEEIKMTYSGYVQIGEKLMAIINGTEYQAGEELSQPGYVVEQITPEKVVIKVGNRKTISLPLEETM